MSAARLVLPTDAPREEWLAARREGITASEIAAVLGLSPWQSPYALYWRKVGELPEQDDNDSMRWGRRLEAAIADEYADRHPELYVVPGGLYASTERPWQMATPDRLLHDTHLGVSEEPVSVLEVKTDATLDGWGDDGTDDIPVHYRCQALWQMDALGVEVATVALLVRGRVYREYILSYDPGDITVMRDAARDFLDRIDLKDPPPVDWRPATTDALKRLHPDVVDVEVEIDVTLAAEYRRACDRSKAAERDKKQVENEIREAIGFGRVAVAAGEKVATRSVYDMTTFDRDALKRDWPDAWKACQSKTTVNKLIPARRTP